MVGDRIRYARVTQQRSLADVAGKADVSVATLSRVENSKQALDLDLFLRLARILKVTASDLLGEEADREALPLAETLARMSQSERTKLWRDLTTTRQKAATHRKASEQIFAQVEELLAQVEFLRSELESVRRRVRQPKRRSRA